MPPCPHGRARYVCKDCGGKGICEHGRERYGCKECGGSGLCEHGRQRRNCKKAIEIWKPKMIQKQESESREARAHPQKSEFI